VAQLLSRGFAVDVVDSLSTGHVRLSLPVLVSIVHDIADREDSPVFWRKGLMLCFTLRRRP
jgi:hypothetical protein